MSKKVSALGQGALAGAGLGASLGSVVGPWGTAIGGAAGAIGGGLYGYLSTDEGDEEAEAQRQAMAQSQDAAKQDAWEQFMLASAPKASNALKNRARLEMGYGQIDRRGESDLAMFEAQREAQDQAGTTQGLTQLAQAGSTIGNKFYNAGRAPSASSFAPMQQSVPTQSAQISDVRPADLASIQAPNYTPSNIVDPSLSPEQQDLFDAENLKPLRRGQRVGF